MFLFISLSGTLALVFTHIALEDKGNWTCEANAKDIKERKSFELLVYRMYLLFVYGL